MEYWGISYFPANDLHFDKLPFNPFYFIERYSWTSNYITSDQNVSYLYSVGKYAVKINKWIKFTDLLAAVRMVSWKYGAVFNWMPATRWTIWWAIIPFAVYFL